MSHLDDPLYWRAKADESRAMADQMTDLKTKEAMLDIAATYERLAEAAAHRMRARPND